MALVGLVSEPAAATLKGLVGTTGGMGEGMGTGDWAGVGLGDGEGGADGDGLGEVDGEGVGEGDTLGDGGGVAFGDGGERGLMGGLTGLTSFKTQRCAPLPSSLAYSLT